MLVYFEIGLKHILDLQGYDHMLFIAVLIASVPLSLWKQLIWLITAFTLGHSLTLAFTILQRPLIPAEWVEFLIPITIFIAALSNLLNKTINHKFQIGFTTFFGLIHGMGFAGYLSSLLPQSMPLWKPLLFFNLGVEVGQLIFAASLIGLFLLYKFITDSSIQHAQTTLSIAGAVVSLFLIFEKLPIA
jgi:hypothetical protein